MFKVTPLDRYAHWEQPKIKILIVIHMKYILKKSLDIKQQELQGSTSTFSTIFLYKHQNPHITFVLEKI